MPRPVARARGNEKGRVERAISYIRTSFFPARQWKDVDDLNRQALEWCHGLARERPWPQDDHRTVLDAFVQEKPTLLALPENCSPIEERVEASVGKTPYVRFDGNDYSLPHEHVRCIVLVVATPCLVRIVVDGEVVAEHARSYDRRQQIENPTHIERLRQAKTAARQHRGLDRLSAAAPSAATLIEQLAARGGIIGSATAAMLRLLDTYGAAAVEDAISEALEHRTPHPHAVRQILERRHHDDGLLPPIPVQLPDNPQVRNLIVRPHPLSDYDNLTQPHQEEDDHDGEDNCTTGSL